ncbi:retropepsin-like aspartic protease family protein [Neokomagataea anthophila]|uniref:Retroviral-like aspartic protease family protein n=1 Tax=Neokomagataea anthophila TaxID=2826925 RepID=A0ABS5E9G3_9PROT|nr:retroviral-like aspartic protease family protein [Neokomagataea anthophila]MBR0560549.1 retroviral-like aspartic protease family protein [Neokomagataea anthophila]
MKYISLACTLFALGLANCADDGSCHITSLGNMEVINNNFSPIVRATVNGHPVAFLVDTGASQSLIWSAQIEPLGVTTLPQSILLNGVGGSTFANLVSVDTLGIGSGIARNVTLLSTGEKSGHNTIAGLPIVGLFGADFLRNYDIAMDLPQHQIALFDVEGCTGQIPPWPGKYTSIPFSSPINDRNKIGVTLKINDHPIDAIIDSGASSTLLAEDDVLDAGIKKTDLHADKSMSSYGVSEDKVTNYLHKFKSFSIDSLNFHNITLSVADVDINLLGADFLRHYRLWIPKRQSTLYLQPEGNTEYVTVQPRLPQH